MRNCILWGNIATEGLAIYEKEKPITVTYSNIQNGHTGEGNIDSDPIFADAANNDLHLQLSSPCLDTGTPDGAPIDDLDGYIRPIGRDYDMGAYEYHYDTLFWQGYSNIWGENQNWQPSMVPVEFNAVVISELPSEREWPVVNDSNAVAEKVMIESGTLLISHGKLSIGAAADVEPIIDRDGDGYTIDDGDCNDYDPSIHPGAPEVCDGIDNNCNGAVDEGC